MSHGGYTNVLKFSGSSLLSPNQALPGYFCDLLDLGWDGAKKRNIVEVASFNSSCGYLLNSRDFKKSESPVW